jgi:hypothetical protein
LLQPPTLIVWPGPFCITAQGLLETILSERPQFESPCITLILGHDDCIATIVAGREQGAWLDPAATV